VSTKRKIVDHTAITDNNSLMEEQSFRALRWWRSTRAFNFHAPALSQMRAAIANVAMLGEPRWSDAAAGDPAAAVAIALAMGPANSHALKFDMCMTALVVCACEGDAASCLVIAYMLKRLPKVGRREKRLSTSWTVRAMRPLLAKIEGGL
jgi:hypothetical protein